MSNLDALVAETVALARETVCTGNPGEPGEGYQGGGWACEDGQMIAPDESDCGTCLRCGGSSLSPLGAKVVEGLSRACPGMTRHDGVVFPCVGGGVIFGPWADTPWRPHVLCDGTGRVPVTPSAWGLAEEYQEGAVEGIVGKIVGSITIHEANNATGRAYERHYNDLLLARTEGAGHIALTALAAVLKGEGQ